MYTIFLGGRLEVYPMFHFFFIFYIFCNKILDLRSRIVIYRFIAIGIDCKGDQIINCLHLQVITIRKILEIFTKYTGLKDIRLTKKNCNIKCPGTFQNLSRYLGFWRKYVVSWTKNSWYKYKRGIFALHFVNIFSIGSTSFQTLWMDFSFLYSQPWASASHF